MHQAASPAARPFTEAHGAAAKTRSEMAAPFTEAQAGPRQLEGRRHAAELRHAAQAAPGATRRERAACAVRARLQVRLQGVARHALLFIIRGRRSLLLLRQAMLYLKLPEYLVRN